MLSSFILHILGNSIGILIADKLIEGVNFTGDLTSLLLIGLILGILNGIGKPLLTIISFPLMILTFGAFSFVISAFLVFAATFIVPEFSVTGILPLLLTTLLLSVINTIIPIFKK